MSKIYRVQVQVEPMLGSSLPEDWAGAYVNAYVAASNFKEAIESCESALAMDKYQPVDIYAAWEIDLSEDESYESDNDEDNPSREELIHIRSNGGVLYSAFHGYLPEQGQVQ